MKLWIMDLKSDTLVPCHSLAEHKRWHSTHRRDHKEFVGATFIYTLFLGCGDLPFVVKVIGPRGTKEERFPTWKEAIQYHALIAARLITQQRINKQRGSRGRVT